MLSQCSGRDVDDQCYLSLATAILYVALDHRAEAASSSVTSFLIFKMEP